MKDDEVAISAIVGAIGVDCGREVERQHLRARTDQHFGKATGARAGFEDCLAEYEVLGPPDIESRIGLTGGNIFQGEVTPDQMWEGRLQARTPVPGLYMCGAATHPAGSVIALNGRNAAAAVLADAGVALAAA